MKIGLTSDEQESCVLDFGSDPVVDLKVNGSSFLKKVSIS